MLEKPDLADAELIAALARDYNLAVSRLTFMPLGADVNTAVYRAFADDADFFVKLRRSDFDPLSVEVPAALHREGIERLIPPIATNSGGLWSRLGHDTLMLYPYVSGEDAAARPLSASQWAVFGQTLRRVHGAELPQSLRVRLPREDFSPHWRERVRTDLDLAGREPRGDWIAREAARFLVRQRPLIERLVARAEQLAARLMASPPPLVLCHGDIHAANILIDDAGRLSIVDWDTLLLAPPERDLMFIGAGIIGVWNTPVERAAFFAGYGNVAVDPVALAYYRYERIVEDIAAFAAELLLSERGGEDRERGLGFLTGSFAPGGVVEIALATDMAS